MESSLDKHVKKSSNSDKAMKMRLLLLFVSLGACVAFPAYASDPTDETQLEPAVQSQPDESSLEGRVTSRWDALTTKDFAQVYEYFTPTYRKLFPAEHYLDKVGSNVDWISADIQNISVDGARAEVTLLLHYRLELPPQAGVDLGKQKLNRITNETWLWKDEDWWYVDPDGGRL